MRYIQYFEPSAMDNTKLIEACGDRAVLIIDGRYRISRCIEEAIINNGHRRPKYDAFQIFEGASILRSKPVTDIIKFSSLTSF